MWGRLDAIRHTLLPRLHNTSNKIIINNRGNENQTKDIVYNFISLVIVEGSMSPDPRGTSVTASGFGS